MEIKNWIILKEKMIDILYDQDISSDEIKDILEDKNIISIWEKDKLIDEFYNLETVKEIEKKYSFLKDHFMAIKDMYKINEIKNNRNLIN